MSRGRPRSPSVDVAVSQAVHELLASEGYPALSVEQVARAAKVGKAAIYRRWASKAEMVFALVVHDEAIEAPLDQGSLAGDLRVLAEHVIDLLAAPAAREALPGLLADLQRDTLLAARFQASFIDAERSLVASLLERAVARGELVTRPDPADVHAQLLGTAFTWILLVADEPPPDLAGRIAAAVFATLTKGQAPCPPPSSSPCPSTTSTSATAGGSTLTPPRYGTR